MHLCARKRRGKLRGFNMSSVELPPDGHAKTPNFGEIGWWSILDLNQ